MNKKNIPVSIEKEVPTITLLNAINNYNQLCSNLESEIVDLEIALESLLIIEPGKLAICEEPFKAADITQEVVNINRRLQRAISTIYNIKINLGI